MNHSDKSLAIPLLTPASCGWRAMISASDGDWHVEERPSLPEAVAAAHDLAGELRLPKEKAQELPLNVALPVRCGVFERLTLPAIDRDELAAMVRLQFEKSLPYPVEETSFGIQVLSQTEAETTLMACAAREEDLSQLCAPLLKNGVPRQLTFWAMHVAAQAPADAVACGIWSEEGRLVFGIFENGRLGYIELLTGGGNPCAELPSLLMRAEMTGAPTDFTELWLDPSLDAISSALSSFLRVPVRPIAPQAAALDGVDLTPEKWHAQQNRRERRIQLRRRLILAGAAYVAAVVTCFAYLGIQKGRLQSLRKEAAALQPQVDALIDRQARWKALAPVVDKRYFTVELLFQTWQCLPTPETRITRFELSRGQLVVEGEAPNAQQAILFAEKLRTQPELADYRFESGPPVLLPNDHAQFRIFGKQ